LGQPSTTKYNWESFWKAALSRNNNDYDENEGFQFVDYETHVAISLLYLFFYGSINLDFPNVIGYGNPAATGSTDSLGMTDSCNKEFKPIDDFKCNFFGLEDWAGVLEEFLYKADMLYPLIQLYNDGNSTERALEVKLSEGTKNTSYMIESFVFNDTNYKKLGTNPTKDYSNYPDLTPKITSKNSGTYLTGSYFAFNGEESGSNVITRGSYGNNCPSLCGLDIYQKSTLSIVIGTRLTYVGKVTDITDTDEAANF
jgi:hypothetical protein